MFLNETKFFLLISIATLGYQAIYAMQPEEPLMPLFELSPAGKALMEKGTPAGIMVMYDPNNIKLPIEFRKKLELYRGALMKQDYPLTMDHKLEEKIILHTDVMEAILTRSLTHGKPDSRNDYIRAFFTSAARVGNIDALKFFIDKRVKINDVRWGWNDENALDWTIRKKREEAKNFLMQNGAKPTPGIEQKWQQ